MNTEETRLRESFIRVIVHDDGVYNLQIGRDACHTKIQVTESEAKRICDQYDEDLPDPDPEPPEEWS